MINELQKDRLKLIFLLVFFTFLYRLPLFSFLIYIIWPIPIVYFIEKYDARKAVLVIFLSALLNTALISLFSNDISSGIIIGMYSIIGFGLIGFLLGSAIKERFSPLKTLIVTITAVFLSNLILTYVFNSTYQEIWDSVIPLIEGQLTEENMFILEHSLAIAKLITPVTILMFSTICGILIYNISTWYMKKKGTDIKRYKPIKEWRFPRWPITFFSSVLIILIFLQERVFFVKPDIVNPILINLLLFLLFLVFLQGFAVIAYYFTMVKSGVLRMIVIILLLFLSIYSFLIIILIGLIDMWFNLRKERTE